MKSIVMLVGIGWAVSIPSFAVDCVEMVDHYQAKRAKNVPAAMLDIFPGWKGLESLPFMFTDTDAINSTDLICDYAGQVERFRYAWGWAGENVDEGEIAKTVSAMLVLSDFFAPDSMALVEAFERTVESRQMEVQDLPGPYQVSMEASLFGPAGGVLTMTVEHDDYKKSAASR